MIAAVSGSSLIARIEDALPGRTFAFAMLVFVAFCWAGTVVAGRAATPDVPPMAINFWRWLIALVAVLPFTARALAGKRAILGAHWRDLLLLGVLNMTAFGGLFFLGLEHTQAINGSILLATMTVNIVLVSWLFFGVVISRLQMCGVAVGFLGILTIIVRGEPSVLLTLSVEIGDPLLWASTLCYAFYSTNLRRAPAALTPAELMTVLCAIGVVTCLPLYLVEAAAVGRSAEWTPRALVSVGFIALFPSLIAQILWVAGVARVGANTAGYFIYTVPAFGALMAMAFLGEAPRWYHGAGIVLVFAGVYAATSRAERGAPNRGQTV